MKNAPAAEHWALLALRIQKIKSAVFLHHTLGCRHDMTRKNTARWRDLEERLDRMMDGAFCNAVREINRRNFTRGDFR